MPNLTVDSIMFYCVFRIFTFYQVHHVKHFQGESEVFGIILHISAFAGFVTSMTYLLYYGWHVDWLSPVILFLVGTAATTTVGFFAERITGWLALSMCGFFVWPVCAYFMFNAVPIGP